MNSIITNPPATQEGIGIQTAVLTADFPKTNDTLAVVTGWSDTITLEAGKTYRVTGQFVISADTGGYNFDFNGGTVTVTDMDGGALVWESGIATVQFAQAPNLNFGLSGADGIIFVPFDMTMQIATSGTLTPRLAQQTTDAAASTLKKYSTISAQEISPTPSY